MKKIDKAKRLAEANELLIIISSCGHHFFSHNGRVSHLEIDYRGRIWFIDSHTNKRVYVAYKYGWRGFTEGGTLRALIENLCDYIRSGKQLTCRSLGPWDESLCGGDIWGYGAEMSIVRAEAQRLGIMKT